MRKLILTLAAFVAVTGAAALSSERALALTGTMPAGIASAAQKIELAEKARYVCRRVCDWRGCWRRCWHTAPRYYGYYYHRPHRHYGYRWHRRHWRYR